MATKRKPVPPSQQQPGEQPLLVDRPPQTPIAGDSEDLLSDRLARQIRLSILRGESAAGSRLNLDEMKGRYDVSLSPLREALSRLTAEGFVNFEAKRGFRVSEMSRANLVEIVTIRRLCEPVAIRESVLKGDEEWEGRVAAAEHMLGKRVRAKTSPTPGSDWEIAYRKFNLAVLSGCGMPMLIHFCSTLMDLQDRYRLLLIKSGAHAVHAENEHRALFEACMHRDAKRAEKLALERINRTYDQLMSVLGVGPKASAQGQ